MIVLVNSKGGHWLVIVWILNQLHVKRSYFGSCLAVALENKVLKYGVVADLERNI